MTDRTEQLQQWWESLDETNRQHARTCAESGQGDAKLAQSLMSAGIGLVTSEWVGTPGSSMVHVPHDVQDFVEKQR